MRILKVDKNSIGFVSEDLLMQGKVHIIGFTDRYYYISKFPIVNGGKFYYNGKEYTLTKLKKPSTRLLISILRRARDEKSVALELITELKERNVICGIEMPKMKKFDIDMNIAILCDEWLSYPNECAYTDSILDQIVALVKKLHRK